MSVQSVNNQIVKAQYEMNSISAEIAGLNQYLGNPYITPRERNRIILRLRSRQQRLMNLSYKLTQLRSRLQVEMQQLQLRSNSAAFRTSMRGYSNHRRRYY